jgi:hypothetical protein
MVKLPLPIFTSDGMGIRLSVFCALANNETPIEKSNKIFFIYAECLAGAIYTITFVIRSSADVCIFKSHYCPTKL